MWLAASVDWTPVIVAAITLAGVVFTGIVNLLIYRHVRPPSHRRLGELVEETHTITASRVAAQLERLDRAQQADYDARDDTA